ncbi:MAG: YCF48-related protein [Candidatus Saganbacteria bacterium]|nr:YCF48-related protein [Candidatus Saganbacteria bacterium]
MRKILLSFLLFLCAVLFLYSCGQGNNSNPDDSAVGWAVGGNTNGYAVILHTTNGGTTWVRQGTSETIPDAPLGEICAIDNQTAWAVGQNINGYGTILRTNDGGTTWTRQGSTENIPDAELVDIRALNRNIAWVSGYNGTLLKTTDAGLTWQRITIEGIASTDVISYMGIGDANHLWATGYAQAGYPSFIYFSADGGATWNQQAASNPYLANNAIIDFFALDAEHAWLVGISEMVLSTSDGGQNWNYISWTAGGLAHANGVWAYDTNNVWVAVDYGSMCFTSTNGATWEIQSAADPFGRWLLRVTGFTPQVVWATGSATHGTPLGGIIHTVDGGKHWQDQTIPIDVRLRGLSFVGAKR